MLNNPLKYRDPDGCEQAGALTNGGSDGYPSTDSLGGPMSWSLAPQNIGKVSPGDPMCMWAMLILWGIAGGPLWAMMAPESLKAAGAKVVGMVTEELGKLSVWWKGLSGYDKLIVLFALKGIIDELLDWLFDLEDYDIDLTDGGFIVTVKFDDGTKKGFVFVLHGDSYRWKYDGETYYVLIDDEWVPMPGDWRPRKPLPPPGVK